MASAVLERRPDLEGGHLLMGHIYLKGKEFEKARGHFESAIKVSSKLKAQS